MYKMKQFRMESNVIRSLTLDSDVDPGVRKLYMSVLHDQKLG